MRDCTCVGSCRGADGLAPGWRCVLDKPDPAVERYLDRHRRFLVSAALTELGRQLTVAAGLTRAFRLGEQFQLNWQRRWMHPGPKEAWRPGVGKAAP